MGDASAEGFGAGTQYPELEFDPKGGLNLREAQNLVNNLLAVILAGKHDGCKVWCFTDNAI